MLDLYAGDPQRRPILERYVRRNLFELSRMGQGVSLVTEKELSSLERDSTVIMSVVILSERKAGGVECPLCKAFIAVTDKGADRVLWYAHPAFACKDSIADYHVRAVRPAIRTFSLTRVTAEVRKDE